MSQKPIQLAPRSAGFTVLELTVSLAVTVIILLAVLQLFDFSSKLSRVQSNVADMQQTQRVSHYELSKVIRMAGRGGLPAGNLPVGMAVSVRDNVPANSTIDGGARGIVAGTDVLTVRGAINQPVYVIERGATSPAFTYNAVLRTGTVRVRDNTYGSVQALGPLVEAINERRPEALLLISSANPNTYVTVELDPFSSSLNLTPVPPETPHVVVGFRFTGTAYTAAYSQFSSSGAGIFPVGMTEISRLSIMEEYRYYIREERQILGDATSEMVRRLSRAQVYPGMTIPYKGEPSNWAQDIADDVLDLQIALGVNTSAGTCLIQVGGANTACDIEETTNGSNDDWLLNDGDAINALFWSNADLYYIRISTLVRTDKRDLTYEAPLIARIENRDYTTLSANTAREDRMYRRRVLRTVIDSRNL